MNRYLMYGAAGEVKRLLQQESDLPGLAESKVALHLLDRLDHPSFEEGIRPPSAVGQIVTISKGPLRTFRSQTAYQDSMAHSALRNKNRDCISALRSPP